MLKQQQLQVFDAERFLKAFQADKKHSPGQYHLIVPTSTDPAGLGVKEIKLPADQASLVAVLAAMEQALSTLEAEVATTQYAPVVA